jgi:sialidase-1
MRRTLCRLPLLALTLFVPLLLVGHAKAWAADVTPLAKPTVLWTRGTEGYAIFKVPTLIADRDGEFLLAIAEARIGSAADQATTHLAMKRSVDGGRSWSATSLIHADGKRTAGNPAPVLDRDTGVVWLFFCVDNREIWLTSSADGGLTWTKAANVSGALKRPEQTGFVGTGPGHGIQLAQGAKRGRLLVPAYAHQEALGGNSRGSKSVAIFSDDHGKSWQMGQATQESTTGGPDGNECMATQLGDGRIYLTIRNNLTRGNRAYAISADSGSQWSAVQLEPTLPEAVCEASIIAYDLPGRGRVHFYVGPSVVATGRKDKFARRDLSLWESRDDCRRWEKRRLLCEGPSAYSDLAVLSDGTLGCVYEAGKHRYDDQIVFARFRVAP